MNETHEGPELGKSRLPSSSPVVGIGASAGGIKALREFFSHVPTDSGIAWVVILHLSPDHDSRLAEILQNTAKIPVTQVNARVAIAADHVYVVPPNQSLEITGDMLVVGPMTRPEHRRAPVDVFFRALADAHAAHSVCVVLSGTGPNGSSGLKRVKERGGLAIVQQPEEAEYSDMPRNSIATGLVDFVLPVAQIPDRIVRYFDGLRQIDDASAAELTADPDALRDVLAMLRTRTGHDFSNYKSATLKRRIERRVHLRSLSSIAEYAALLAEQPEEAVALMKELLISVTTFFRDPVVWEALEQRIIPRLFHNKGSGDQVRVWVPGCATGEEAYTIAMLLAEHAATLVDRPALQVFGTDLDDQAVRVGREGVYSDADLVDVPEARILRFFSKEPGGYRARRELREMLLFARHNVIKDPPFSHLDLISCRNLLIYLNRSVQARVIETFHFALRPGGVLFLGTSESPDSTTDRFRRIDTAVHVYESRPVMSHLVLPLGETAFLTVPAPLSRPSEHRPSERISPADLHQRLLEQYAPPSLVVTEEYNVVHMSDRVGRYLQVPGGEPPRELFRMVHPDLRGDLRAALHQAARERRRVDIEAVPVHLDDGPRAVDIVIRPALREGDPLRGFFLISFQEGPAIEQPPDRVTLSSPAGTDTRHVEEELARVKVQLAATIEQYETQAEELKAGNEELQAMNEELRSAAEELETSKEELQSINEELTTVNQELKIKIEELGLKNNDFQNFINSTDIGTIFLDRRLHVKLFTPRAQDLFNLLDTDVGRPLTDITNKLNDHQLAHDMRIVLERLQTIEREVRAADGRWHLLRILPYRTTDDRIEGVVVTLQDITSRRTAESQVRQSEERLRLLIDSAFDYAILTTTDDGRIDSWNAGAERLFGYRAEEIVGRSAEVLFTPEDRAAGVPATELEEARRTGSAVQGGYRIRKNGERFHISGKVTRLGKDGLGFAEIARDLTSQHEAADALQRAQTEMESRTRERTDNLEAEKRTVTELLRRLVSAQEDERGRIARDLHDSLGQQLTALRLALERHQEACSATDRDRGMMDALALTRNVSHEVDFLAWQLRPAALDDFGLSAALPRFVNAWSVHAGIPAECRVSNFEAGQLGQELEVAFYRIAQEALNNVAKHAHASRADVVLSTADGDASLVVEDDGVGFEPSDPAVVGDGIGMVSMRERASLVGATLQIESAVGRGTSVFLRAKIAAGPQRGGEGRHDPRAAR